MQQRVGLRKEQDMNLLTLLVVVALAGGLGGAFNGAQINFFRSSLTASDPVVKELKDKSDLNEEDIEGIVNKKPGEKVGSFLFNLAAGALAASVSWAAYGPYALENVFGGTQSNFGLSLTALATAFVIGFGGPRWLTNERDKALLKQAGADAARTKPSQTKRELIERGDPKQAAQIASMDIS